MTPLTENVAVEKRLIGEKPRTNIVLKTSDDKMFCKLSLN